MTEKVKLRLLKEGRHNGFEYRVWNDGTRQWFDEGRMYKPGKTFLVEAEVGKSRDYRIAEYRDKNPNKPTQFHGPFPTLKAAIFTYKLMLS